MQLARPWFALNPARFGRRAVRSSGTLSTLGADARLFATTFIAGFLFVLILIA